MRELEFPLDRSDTLTIGRVITPPRIPNKGKGVYRFDSWLGPVLKENGWQLVGYHKRKRCSAYFRSPAGINAETFVIHAAIPDDAAILRLAAAMIRFATRPPGPRDPIEFDGWLGNFHATFYTRGRRFWGEGFTWDFPGAEEALLRDRVPTLEIGLFSIWDTRLFWLDGYENPPRWDRSKYFSALTSSAPPGIGLI